MEVNATAPTTELAPEEVKKGLEALNAESKALEDLRKENELLKETLKAFQSRLNAKAHALPADDKLCLGEEELSASMMTLNESLNTEKGTQDFYRKLQKHVESPQFLAMLEAQDDVVYVVNPDDTNEVGVTDIENIDWWTLAPEPKKYGREVEVESLGGGWVFVEHDDVIQAIGEFVALYLSRLPRLKNMSHPELQKVLANTFAEFQEKSPVGRLWDWGVFLYSAYGWASTALTIYREPEVTMYVLRALWTITKWGVSWAFVLAA